MTETPLTDAPPAAPKPLWKRLLPLGIIAAALAAFFALGGPGYVSIDGLRDNREALSALVADNFLLVWLGFIALYAVLVGISFPGASFLSIFGGFLFGTWVGGLGVVVGATLGATAIFLAARYAFGDALARKAGPYMQKFEAGLKKNELSYLFILRLIPAFPFFIVNIVPALFDVHWRNYVLSTFFGIIPGSLVYASVGAGVGAIFDAGEDVELSGLMLQPQIILPILGLIALSLLPILYKTIKGAPAGAA
ncbi:VTT domain-containing protein [uncultured Algimonas sp.]|uniref:TVP38/TMEM64 family protein n=1 Tax=uncultured Algimonas sp. TaxID=1547920 RepID=UPI0026164DF4|nr:VTT domain-containing protein [uncultured Algimonas sp.]